MSEGFVHSVKVPRFYKVTAKTVQSVQEDGASIKQLIYEKKHPNLRGTYGLAVTTIQHGPQLDQLLRKTQLLLKESRLDPWLARVLIAELLWGKKSLASEAKPIKTVLSYEKVLLEESKNLDNADGNAISGMKVTVQKPRYVRVNTLVTSIQDSIRSFTDDGWTLLPKSRNYSAYLKALAKLGEWMFIQDYHIPELFAFPPGTLFHNHPGYQSGAIVLQDKASCLPAYLLNAVPGSTVLDMCSAPGMKTTHLAAIMKNKGKIIAVERDTRRYKTLCEMVKTNHADCVTTVNADAMKDLTPVQVSDVEYILVDPSCSGSGMLDRLSLGHEASKCAPGRLISLQSFQVLLLRHALLNFPKAKRIVYSTCSMYPEENEMVVDEVLGNVGDAYNLVPITKLIGSDWKNFSSTDYKCEDKCLYARPDVDMSNGFFVAVFERNFDVPLPEYQRKEAPQKRKNDDENQPGKKKRRRRSRANGVAENGEVKKGEDIAEEKQIKKKFESVAEETLVQEGQKKPKKKKHNEITENLDTEKHTEVQSAISEEDTSAEKKKKKKKKKVMDAENSEEVNGTSEPSPVEEQKSKKKKKKKETDLEILEVVPKVEISDEQKSKKKKKKHSDLEILEVIPKVEITDEQKSKKKKKKHSDLEILEAVPKVENSDELNSKKKKKKKKDNAES